MEPQKVFPTSPTDLVNIAKIEMENDLPNTQPAQSQVLEGVVAFVEVRTKADNRSRCVSRQMESMGARIEKTFTSSVTHVVFKEGSRRTLTKAQKRGIPLVSVLWVESCRQNQLRVSEKLFPATVPEDNGSPVVGRLRKMKSMQPRDYEEELQLSAERWRKRQRRLQLKNRFKLVEEDTPTRRGNVLVYETQPRTPSMLRSLPSPSSLTIPSTPLQSQTPLRFHTPLSAAVAAMLADSSPEDPDAIPPLHKRLFANGSLSDNSFGTPKEQPSLNRESHLGSHLDDNTTTSTTRSHLNGDFDNNTTTHSHLNGDLDNNTTTHSHRNGDLDNNTTTHSHRNGDLDNNTTTHSHRNGDHDCTGDRRTHLPSDLGSNTTTTHSHLNCDLDEGTTTRHSHSKSGTRAALQHSHSQADLDSSTGTPRSHGNRRTSRSGLEPNGGLASPDADRRRSARHPGSPSVPHSRQRPRSAAAPSTAKRRSLLPCQHSQSESASVLSGSDREVNSATSAQDHVSSPSRPGSALLHQVDGVAEAESGCRAGKRAAAARVETSRLTGSTQEEILPVQAGRQPVLGCSQPKKRRLIKLEASAPPSSFLMSPTYSSQEDALSSIDSHRLGARGRTVKVRSIKAGEGENQLGAGLAGSLDGGDASLGECGNQGGQRRGRVHKRSLPTSPQSGESQWQRPSQPVCKVPRLAADSPDSRQCLSSLTDCPPIPRAGGPQCELLNLSSSDLSPESSGRQEVPRIELDDIISRLETDEEDEASPGAPSPPATESGRHSKTGSQLDVERGGGTGQSGSAGRRRGARRSAGDSGSGRHPGRSRRNGKVDDLSGCASVGSGGEESQTLSASGAGQGLGASMSAVFGDSFSASSLVPQLAPARRSLQEFSLGRRKLAASASKTRLRAGRKAVPLGSISEVGRGESTVPDCPSPRQGKGREARVSVSDTDVSSLTDGSDKSSTPTTVRLRHAQSFHREMSAVGRQESSTQSASQTGRHRPSLVMTSLHRQEQDVVQSVVAKLGVFEIRDAVCETTTHVVCGERRRTMNVLGGIARGCWLLDQEWVLRSLEAGQWLGEEDFELVDRFPQAQAARRERQSSARRYRQQLFSKLGTIHVAPKCHPPRREIASLLLLCGAQVAKSASQAAVAVGEVELPGCLTIRPLWVLDSIEAQKALPQEKYVLKSRPQRDPSPEF